MGWYDDEEEAWLPAWVIPPMMWIGCLATAVLPAGVIVGGWTLVFKQAPPGVVAVAYAVSLGLMLAAVKPWSIR
ncbi:hypothetical protein [Caulobacter rhizosphaerae]|jgi:hypothetical protein|uniref:hypothetical protein n=1 Tax=Caulobacter rhizosphaerae TaxID=2010972 RepID=UPI0013D289E5|nr:hypothetical protein [Caulobacter rhizosphaerae]